MLLKIFLFSILSLVIWPAKAEPPAQNREGFEFNRNRRSVRLPARISHNLVVIPMRINDSPPLNFILDTGINTTILTEPMVAFAFDLPIHELVYVLGLGNEGIIEAGMSKGLTFQLNGITGNNMNLIIIPEGVLSFSEMFGFPVHGIIGYDLFKEFPVRINYRAHSVRVFRQPNYRKRRNSQTLPLELTNNKPYVYVNARGKEGHPLDSLRLLLDIGATNPLFLNKEHLEIAPERIPAYLGRGVSGELKGEVGRLRYLRLGDFSFTNPLVAFPEQDFLEVANLNLNWEGILGAGILSRFHMIIDYPSKQVVLTPNNEFSRPFRHNASGIEVIAKGVNYTQFEVDYVRENSVAAERGIKAGDKIISIDGEPMRRKSMDEVVAKFNQSPGTMMRLEIMREDTLLRISLKLREDI